MSTAPPLSPDLTGRRFWSGPWAAAGVVLLAFAVRLAHLLEFSELPIFDRPAVDAALYLDAARTWSRGEFPAVFFKPPLYPAVLAGAYRLWGDDIMALRLLGAVSGAFTCGVAWWLGRRLFGPRIALAAGIGLALHRTAVYFDGELLETSLATLLHVLGLALVLRACEPDRSWRATALAGLVLGAGAVARPVILVFAGAGAWWLGRRRLLPFLGGLAIAIAPVTLHNALRGGDAVLISSNVGLNFYLGNNAAADGRTAKADVLPANPVAAERNGRSIAEAAAGHALRPSQISDYWLRRGLGYAAANPGRALALLGRKLFFAWTVAEISDNEDLAGLRWHLHLYRFLPVGAWIVLPLGLTGLLLAPRRREVDLARLYVLAQIAAVLPFFVVARFRIPWLPVLAIFAAWCAVEIVRRFREHMPGRVRIAGAVAASAVVCGIPAFDVRAPIDLDLDYKIAYAYQQKGKTTQAMDSYRAAVARNPNHALALNALGVLMAEQGGDLAAAEDLVARALRADATHAANYNESLADIRLRRGDTSGALEACAAGLAAEGDSTVRALLYWRRAEAHRARGAPQDELAAVRAMLATGITGARADTARARQEELNRTPTPGPPSAR